METPVQAEKKCIYEFGSFRVNHQKRLLTRHGSPVQLTPKTFETLLLLLDAKGRLVLKKDLMAALWPDSFVEEANLNQHIFMLRKALGETALDHQYIVTVPGSGYRFAADIRELVKEQPPEPWDRLAVSLNVEKKSDFTRSNIGILSLVLRVGAMALVILGVLVFLGERYDSKHSRDPKPRSASGAYTVSRRTLAILGFQNLSAKKKDAWLSTALSEMLSTELAAGEQLRIISGDDVARVKSELAWKERGSLEGRALEQFHTNLGANLLVLGSYTTIGDKNRGQIRLDLRLQNADSGDMIAELAETGAEGELFDLVSRAGYRLRQKLGMSELSPSETVVVRASMPATPQAAQAYSEGLASLRIFDAIHARDQFLRAITFDPHYPMSHSALADAWAVLGFDSNASEEARQAFQLSQNLSAEERLVVEGRYREGTREWPKAVAVYKTLAKMFPDNLDYGLRLASAQTASANAQAALATLDTLRLLPPPQSRDPRIGLESSKAWHSLGDFKQMEASLEYAVRNAQASGSRLLLASARSQQCFTWRFLGEQQKAIDACQDAQRIYLAAGDRGGQAETLRLLGDAVSESDVPAAMKFYEQSLAIQKEIGHLWGQATVLNQLAILYSNSGDHSAAMDSFEQALAICRLLDNRVSGTGMMINIGGELASQGKLKQAHSMFQKTFDAARELGNKDIQGLVANNIAMLDQLGGELDAAQLVFQRARGLLEAVEDKALLTVSINGMGEVAMCKGDFEGAQKLYQEAFEIRRSARQKIPAAESRLNLAALAFERGDSSSQVEDVVRKVIGIFNAEKAINDEAAATTVLARILLAQGRSKEALAAAEEAISISAKADLNFRLAAALTAVPSRVAAGRSSAAEAVANLERILVEARKFGYFEIELEAMLALGELELESGALSHGRKQLQVVQRRASQHGFIVLARKAAFGGG
jgi:DNA-binding winged helix-turn-helix (wHTH) protein/tetratricopeptide (TPR) repeat protein